MAWRVSAPRDCAGSTVSAQSPVENPFFFIIFFCISRDCAGSTVSAQSPVENPYSFISVKDGYQDIAGFSSQDIAGFSSGFSSVPLAPSRYFCARYFCSVIFISRYFRDTMFLCPSLLFGAETKTTPTCCLGC